MPTTKKQTSYIIDNQLYVSLIKENKTLRKKLGEVSAVGASMMFHTHRADCNFTRDFLKSIVNISYEINAQDIDSIYKDGHDLALKPSVIEQFESTRNQQKPS